MTTSQENLTAKQQAAAAILEQNKADHLAIRCLQAHNCLEVLDEHLLRAYGYCPNVDQKRIMVGSIQTWPETKAKIARHLEGCPVWPYNLPAPHILPTWDCVRRACSEAARGLGDALRWLECPQDVLVWLAALHLCLERAT